MTFGRAEMATPIEMKAEDAQWYADKRGVATMLNWKTDASSIKKPGKTSIGN